MTYIKLENPYTAIYREVGNWPFNVRYLFYAILSRGYAGQFRLLRDPEVFHEFFIEIDRLLYQREEDLVIKKLTKIFYETVQNFDIMDNQISFDQQYRKRINARDESYVEIRKVSEVLL